MGVEELEDRCIVTECLSAEVGSEGAPREDSDLLSVVVFHDQPFDTVALDERFSVSPSRITSIWKSCLSCPNAAPLSISGPRG